MKSPLHNSIKDLKGKDITLICIASFQFQTNCIYCFNTFFHSKRVVTQTSGVCICSLAMNIAYHFIHCVCHECYFHCASLEGKRASCRSRAKPTINKESPDDTSNHKHNHSILEKFSDLSYFSETFQKKIDDEKYPLPKKCSICKFSLVLKILINVKKFIFDSI